MSKLSSPLSVLPRSERRTLTSPERFQKIVEAVEDYAIYMLDPQGLVESWNPGAERLKGYTADEVLGKSYSIFYRIQDIAEGLPARQLERALIHGKTEAEGWRVRRDGSVFWANVVVSRILDDDGMHIGFAKITRDVTERHRLRELEHSLRRMDEFLAVLTHELRSPLAPIHNAATFLQLNGVYEPKQAAAWGVLNRQLSLLTRLLEDLMDAGRLTSGKLRISPARIDMKKVVSQAAETCETEAQLRAHTLTLHLPAESVEAIADELRITQVVQNLISNAVKFTPPGGRIDVSLRFDTDFVSVEVEDDGQGMDPRTVNDLFALFTQSKDQVLANQHGLGIGLALARTIIEMHGGTIEGSSAGPHLGSAFRFKLPLTKRVADQQNALSRPG